MLLAPIPLTLAQLAQEMKAGAVTIRGEGATLVSGLTEDSRRVQPGMMFVARPGEKFGAEHFVGNARAEGASAVLCAEGVDTQGLPALITAEMESAFGWAAQVLAGQPTHRLPLVGITGTNGKTTTVTLVAEALGILSHRVATLGTLGFTIDRELLAPTLTTPQPDTLASCFVRALAAQADVCLMEVSSHALSQGRVAGAQFEVAAFSNLSQDHLDYHGTLDNYAEAKAKLFELSPRHSVINIDDPFGAVLAQRYPQALRVSRTPTPGAELYAREVTSGREGVRAQLAFRGQENELRSSLVGSHNVDNLLLAVGILLSLGKNLEESVRALGAVKGASGRFERCDGADDDVICLVDYAHTPDALRAVLQSSRELDPVELVCVFGCGGDRDRTKRPLMGAMAASHADVVWVTTDNPRSESPEAIAHDIRPGLRRGNAKVTVELDRGLAIESAILAAAPGSVIAICGKGHEDYQLVGATTLPFDDRVVAKRALMRRRKNNS